MLGKIPKPHTKIERRWVRGVWLGKRDRDDSHILGTSSGAIPVRSVRKLPPESQTDSKMLEDMRGLPWQPRDGIRHRVTPEVSHAGEILGEETEGHPTLAPTRRTNFQRVAPRRQNSQRRQHHNLLYPFGEQEQDGRHRCKRYPTHL